MLRALHELGDLFARLQPDPGLLPIRPLAGAAPLALELAVADLRAHVRDLRAEQLLDGLLDVDFRGPDRDLEHDHRRDLARHRRLLGDDRPADDVCDLHASTSWSRSTAARVTITW